MKLFRIALPIISILFFIAFNASAAEIVSNENIIEMIKTGFSEDLIASKIQNLENSFDVSTDKIVVLRREGVGENIIKMMIEAVGKAEKSKAVLLERAERQYQEALTLRDNGEYDLASNLLKKISNENPDKANYMVSYVDMLLEQIIVLKDEKNEVWLTKARDVRDKIKMLKLTQGNNPDFYLVFAKYAAIVESKRESNITKSLEMTFYLKPNYTYGNLVKGDIYFLKSKVASDAVAVNTATLTGANPYYSSSAKIFDADIAKAAYNEALASAELCNRKKAYIHLKKGDLEDQVYMNKEKAKENWTKAASLNPDSKIGKLAKERLNK